MKVNLGNTEIYYEITGKVNGEWLILLHGMSASTKIWKYQVDDLSKHFKVLNFDLPGHGNSSTASIDKYNFSVVANQVRLLMDKLGIEKAHILGISLGTFIQQYFCDMFPERVISAVFTSPVTKPSTQTRIFNYLSDKLFISHFPKNIYLKLIGALMMPGKVQEKSRKFFFMETSKMDDHEFKKWWKAVMQDAHVCQYIKESSIPTLIVAGEKDFCFLRDSQILKNKYTNCEYMVMENVGHVMIFQKPTEYNNIVIEFLNRQKGSINMDDEIFYAS